MSEEDMPNEEGTPNLDQQAQKASFDAQIDAQKASVDRECLEAALKVATLPSHVTRFELIPMPSLPEHIVLVLGGVLAGGRRQGDGPIETFIHVKMEDAFAIHKTLGADIVVKMRTAMGLTDADLEAASKRNTSAGAANAARADNV